MSYMPYDPGGLEPAADAVDMQSGQPDGAAGADGPRTEAMDGGNAPETAAGALPARQQLPAWLAAIVQRDGLENFMKALLSVVPRDDLFTITERICNERFGDEPLHLSDLGEGRWESNPRPSPAGSTTSSNFTTLLTKRRRQDEAAASALLFTRCWHCEPYMNRQDGVCVELKVFDDLEDELIEKDEAVLQAEQEGEEQSARRAARYYLYRKWVWHKYGYLGKGNRVRIPMCVVEFIRCRYREPGCPCNLGGELYACTRHGYTGHRDAQPPEE